jgi:hypothetical protein
MEDVWYPVALSSSVLLDINMMITEIESKVLYLVYVLPLRGYVAKAVRTELLFLTELSGPGGHIGLMAFTSISSQICPPSDRRALAASGAPVGCEFG